MKISDLIYQRNLNELDRNAVDHASNVISESESEEKQILIRIRQILYDRRLSGTESNAGELHRLRQRLKDLRSKKSVDENFADGKGPGRPGDSQRHGIPKNATMAQLQKAAKAPGRKGQLARWQINMRRGRKNSTESILLEADNIVFVKDKPVEILINPGYQRMVGMAARQSDHDLRLLYIPIQDIVVVWPALDAVHYDMAQALVNQFNWDMGENLQVNMITGQGKRTPISAKFRLSPPIIDSKGKMRRDTNMHRRVSGFAVVAAPAFFNLEWFKRIQRTAPPITETWTNKYKRSIDCSRPRGFSQRAHCAARRKRSAGGKTTSRPVKEDLSTPQKTLAGNLVKLTQQVDLVQMPTANNTRTFITNIDGRPIVVVNFAGHTIPFYCSTGSGGKASVAAGKWYPFWGIGSDGWFNKGTETMINSFYHSSSLAKTAKLLDQYLGNLVGSPGIPVAGASAIAVINKNQQPQAIAQAAADLIKYYARISDQVRRVG